MSELKVQIPNTPMLWCDNFSTVVMSTNSVLHAYTNHFELDLYFVHEKHAKKLEVRHVLSIDQIADIFTKAVSSARFLSLRNKLRVEEDSTLSLRWNVKR